MRVVLSVLRKRGCGLLVDFHLGLGNGVLFCHASWLGIYIDSSASSHAWALCVPFAGTAFAGFGSRMLIVWLSESVDRFEVTVKFREYFNYALLTGVYIVALISFILQFFAATASERSQRP
jgi:hypothetical protein